MYLAGHDELDGIGRSLKKGVKRIGKVVKKVARPALSPVLAAHRAARRPGKVLAMVRAPVAFRPRGQAKIAPAASIPTDDFAGDDMTQAERDALIDDAAPRFEPVASGYPSAEESFAPDVPELIAPDDLKPVAVSAPKKNALPILGGVLLLLNFL